MVDGVITAKAADGKPLLSHERTHIRISMLKTWTGHLDRKGAEWFGRYYGTERLVATQAQTLCADDIERTSR